MRWHRRWKRWNRGSGSGPCLLWEFRSRTQWTIVRESPEAWHQGFAWLERTHSA